MKFTCKIWFPIQSTQEEMITVDIPDGEDPKEWIEEHEDELIEKNGFEGTSHELSMALDLGYAGVKLLKDEREGE